MLSRLFKSTSDQDKIRVSLCKTLESYNMIHDDAGNREENTHNYNDNHKEKKRHLYRYEECVVTDRNYHRIWLFDMIEKEHVVKLVRDDGRRVHLWRHRNRINEKIRGSDTNMETIWKISVGWIYEMSCFFNMEKTSFVDKSIYFLQHMFIQNIQSSDHFYPEDQVQKWITVSAHLAMCSEDWGEKNLSNLTNIERFGRYGEGIIPAVFEYICCHMIDKQTILSESWKLAASIDYKINPHTTFTTFSLIWDHITIHLFEKYNKDAKILRDMWNVSWSCLNENRLDLFYTQCKPSTQILCAIVISVYVSQEFYYLIEMIDDIIVLWGCSSSHKDPFESNIINRRLKSFQKCLKRCIKRYQEKYPGLGIWCLDFCIKMDMRIAEMSKNKKIYDNVIQFYTKE